MPVARPWILHLLAGLSAGLSAYTFERKYSAGEVDHYEILVRSVGFDGELAVVTQHSVAVGAGAAFEDIEFLRASETRAGKARACGCLCIPSSAGHAAY